MHWTVPVFSLDLVGYATAKFDCTLAGYVTDIYTMFSTSAFAAMAMLQALCCGIFPLFTKQKFDRLRSNVALSSFAAVAAAFCVAPVLFLRVGRSRRESGKFARSSLRAYKKKRILHASKGVSGTQTSRPSAIAFTLAINKVYIICSLEKGPVICNNVEVQWTDYRAMK